MTQEPQTPDLRGQLDRRALLVGAGVAVATLGAYPYVRRAFSAKQPVFLARNQRYDGRLAQTIEAGLQSVELTRADFHGKRVLLKPNLVEPTRDAPQMTTNPAIVLAAAEVFRRWGAEVVVGEGPGHVKDTEVALIESRLDEPLRDEQLRFVDLNHDDVALVENRERVSKLKEMFFPRTVLQADFVVSLPKLKTHHWVGMTAAMKNLYGVMPGIKYGWPKNVLHHAGIPESVVDINAALPRKLAIVDAIECMEGDGPIMGTAKYLGVVAVGQNLPALDATLARVIGLNPYRVPYLRLAERRLGPLDEQLIIQRGESWRELRDPFELVDAPWLQNLRDRDIGIKTSWRHPTHSTRFV